jgi:hypothetical protein
VTDAVASTNIGQRLAGIPAPDRLGDLERRQLGFSPKPHPARHCPLPALAGAGEDQRPLEFGQAVVVLLLVWFAERGCPQANRVTLTKLCRCNNSSGDGFGHHRLAGVLKLFDGGFESCAHRRNCLRIERSRLYE